MWAWKWATKSRFLETSLTIYKSLTNRLAELGICLTCSLAWAVQNIFHHKKTFHYFVRDKVDKMFNDSSVPMWIYIFYILSIPPWRKYQIRFVIIQLNKSCLNSLWLTHTKTVFISIIQLVISIPSLSSTISMMNTISSSFSWTHLNSVFHPHSDRT